MARDIDVEIAIAGVALLWITEPSEERPAAGSWRPAKARNLVVLFPPSGPAHDEHDHGTDGGSAAARVATEHRPMLSFYASDNLLLPEGSQLVCSPDGREVVNVDLTGRRVSFDLPYPYDRDHPASTLDWLAPDENGDLPSRPAALDEDAYLDWLLDASDIGLLDPDPARATTVIQLPEGRVSARSVFRNRQSETGDPVLWQVGDKKHQAVAPEVVVRLDGLWQRLTIVLDPLPGSRSQVREEIELLADSRGLLHVSFSNLPQVYDGAHSHLGLLAGLSEGGVITAPVKMDHVFTIGSACDVGYKVGGFPKLASAGGSLLSLASRSATPAKLPPYFHAIGVVQAWDQGKEGRKEVRVAVLDSGIDFREGARDFLQIPHERAFDLTGSGRRGWLDGIGHGTMMASIVAARAPGGGSIRGIAPEVELLNLRVVDGGGLLPDEEVLVAGLKTLLEQSRRARVHVALMAIRLPRSANGIAPPVLAGIDALRDAGTLVVAAAGDALDPEPDPQLARRDHVLVVGAVDDAETRYMSNGSPESVHLAAPGSGVIAASIFSGDRITGSSPAAAFVAGAAALVFSEDLDAEPAEVKRCILDSVRRVGVLADRVRSGGILDVAALLGLPPTQPAVTPSRSSTQ